MSASALPSSLPPPASPVSGQAPAGAAAPAPGEAAEPLLGGGGAAAQAERALSFCPAPARASLGRWLRQGTACGTEQKAAFWNQFLLQGGWQASTVQAQHLPGVAAGAVEHYREEAAAELARLSPGPLPRAACCLVVDSRERQLAALLGSLPFARCEALAVGDVEFRWEGQAARVWERKRADDALQALHSGKFTKQREALRAVWSQRPGCAGYLLESPGWLLAPVARCEDPALRPLKRARVLTQGGAQPARERLRTLRSLASSLAAKDGFPVLESAHVLHTALLVLSLFRAWASLPDPLRPPAGPGPGALEDARAAERVRQHRGAGAGGERRALYGAVRGVSPCVARAVQEHFAAPGDLLRHCRRLGAEAACRDLANVPVPAAVAGGRLRRVGPKVARRLLCRLGAREVCSGVDCDC